MEFSISFDLIDPLAPKTCFDNYSSSHSVIVIEEAGLFFVLNDLVYLTSASWIIVFLHVIPPFCIASQFSTHVKLCTIQLCHRSY